MATVDVTDLTPSPVSDNVRLVGFDNDTKPEIWTITAIAQFINDRNGGGGSGGSGTGWSPVFRLVASGHDVFVEITDWTGGTGVKPAIGYLTSDGVENNDSNAVNIRGPIGTPTDGNDGNHGWSPILTTVADGTRIVLEVTGWTGGSGTEPATGYIGTSGIVSDIADASNIRGTAGIDGTNGTNGWTPTLQVEGDGQRILIRVTGWTGGVGDAPAVGYLGTTGIVADKADAADIRGQSGTPGANGWSPTFAVVIDEERRVVQISGWTGGVGTAPATGYLGASGVVTDIGDAVDIRGAGGAGDAPAGGYLGTTDIVTDKADAADVRGQSGTQANAWSERLVSNVRTLRYQLQTESLVELRKVRPCPVTH